MQEALTAIPTLRADESEENQLGDSCEDEEEG
jgi:hypothetical protein